MKPMFEDVNLSSPVNGGTPAEMIACLDGYSYNLREALKAALRIVELDRSSTSRMALRFAEERLVDKLKIFIKESK